MGRKLEEEEVEYGAKITIRFVGEMILMLVCIGIWEYILL